MRTSVKIVLFSLVLLVATGMSPVVASASETGGNHPIVGCGDLVRGFDLPGAATRVESAKIVTTGTPEYCDVRGVIAPAINFELKLPTKTYGGRYLQYGCGGLCGFVEDHGFPDCGLPHSADVAIASTDAGHIGQPPIVFVDGSWAAHDQAARDDWAFRAAHVLSRAAKRIIETYYGAPPKKSYFSGCSNGGREGLLLAQRYPTDFDGINAGAPAPEIGPLLGVYHTWLTRANTGADGKPILTAAKLPALHDAVVAACDRLDGLADGQLDDPRACHFDPATLACSPGTDTDTCLTPAQVQTVRKIYAPPTDARGRLLYPGAVLPGSEAGWVPWIVPGPVISGVGAWFDRSLGDNYLRYVGYPIGTPTSTVDTFPFTERAFDRLVPEAVRSDALNLDLSAFRRAGGKLIIAQGWGDQAIPPAGTLDYYQRLAERNGGLRQTQEWARLFMVPSMFHCTGGTTLTGADPLRQLVAWVEHGTAPDRIIATGKDTAGNPLTRPVFPYPLVARYNGTGSIDDAANFHAVPPASPPHDVVHWAGDGLYEIPGPVAR